MWLQPPVCEPNAPDLAHPPITICAFPQRCLPLSLHLFVARMKKLEHAKEVSSPHNEAYSIANTQEFERIYARLYPRLCAFAFMILHERSVAEDVVQEAFLSLWKRREELVIHTSIDHYLMRSVYNLALMHHVRDPHRVPMPEGRLGGGEDEAVEGFSDEDLYRLAQVQHAIDALPEQCRRIFLLNKREGMRQKEIAALLSLSIKTIDTQITRAVRKIREYLVAHRPEKPDSQKK